MSLCPTSSPDVTPPDRSSSKRNTSLPKVVHTPLKGGAQGAPTEGTTKRRASAGDGEEVSLSFPYVPTPSIHLSIRSSVVAITRIRAHAHSCLTHTRTPARTHTHTHARTHSTSMRMRVATILALNHRGDCGCGCIGGCSFHARCSLCPDAFTVVLVVVLVWGEGGRGVTVSSK
jgi:hypothetical protein